MWRSSACWSRTGARSPCASSARARGSGSGRSRSRRRTTGGALHARRADETVEVASYLDPAEIVIAAAGRRAPTRCIPGYGFLAESDVLAQAVGRAGRADVGRPAARRAPSSAATRSRRADRRARSACPRSRRATRPSTGFPLLVKAAAGGGGRGMRVVREPAELDEALAAAVTGGGRRRSATMPSTASATSSGRATSRCSSSATRAGSRGRSGSGTAPCSAATRRCSRRRRRLASRPMPRGRSSARRSRSRRRSATGEPGTAEFLVTVATRCSWSSTPDPGRASRDRGGHRARPRGVAAPARRGRATAARRRPNGWPRRRGQALRRGPAHVPAALRSDRRPTAARVASASTPASSRATSWGRATTR